MSEAQDPSLAGAAEVTVEDVRELCGASTPHFALQIRNRITRLIAPLPAGHPARVEGEREVSRLNALGLTGEHRGHQAESGLGLLASAQAEAGAAEAE